MLGILGIDMPQEVKVAREKVEHIGVRKQLTLLVLVLHNRRASHIFNITI